MDNGTPHSLIKNEIGRMNRSISSFMGEKVDVMTPYLIERRLLKGLKEAVRSNSTKLPKMKGMSWPLIEDKIIGSKKKDQKEAYQLYNEGKVYESILRLFPNLKS